MSSKLGIILFIIIGLLTFCSKILLILLWRHKGSDACPARSKCQSRCLAAPSPPTTQQIE